MHNKVKTSGTGASFAKRMKSVNAGAAAALSLLGVSSTTSAKTPPSHSKIAQKAHHPASKGTSATPECMDGFILDISSSASPAKPTPPHIRSPEQEDAPKFSTPESSSAQPTPAPARRPVVPQGLSAFREPEAPPAAKHVPGKSKDLSKHPALTVTGGTVAIREGQLAVVLGAGPGPDIRFGAKKVLNERETTAGIQADARIAGLSVKAKVLRRDRWIGEAGAASGADPAAHVNDPSSGTSYEVTAGNVRLYKLDSRNGNTFTSVGLSEGSVRLELAQQILPMKGKKQVRGARTDSVLISKEVGKNETVSLVINSGPQKAGGPGGHGGDYKLGREAYLKWNKKF